MSERTVISFPVNGLRFNFRVAGVIIKDRHVLVCREDDEDYFMLPGGRIEMGEDSRLSIAREISEELAMEGEIGPLIATSESFYNREGEAFHELGFFYQVSLPGQGPNGQSPWLAREDEGHWLQFHWVSLEGDGLEAINLLPRWLPDVLRQAHQAPVHIIDRDPMQR